MPKLNQKGVAPIFLVVGVILILIASLLIYVSVTPHDPDEGEWMNWKFNDTKTPVNTGWQPSPIPQATVTPDSAQKINVFSSTLYGYSISFPESWKYTTSDENLDANDTVENGLSMNVSVYAADLSASNKVQSEFEKAFAMQPGSSYVDDNVASKHTKVKNFKIAGYDALLMTEHFTYEGEIFYQHYQIKLDAYTTILIDFQADTQMILDKNKNLIEQILSSVKIQPRPEVAKELNIYENEKYGFSFKYPSNWFVSDKLEDDSMPNPSLAVDLFDFKGGRRLTIAIEDHSFINYTAACYEDNVDTADKEELIWIGIEQIKLKYMCAKERLLLQSQNGTKFQLGHFDAGNLVEDQVKEVLKSLTGMKIVP